MAPTTPGPDAKSRTGRRLLWVAAAFSAAVLVVLVGWITGAFPLLPASDEPFVAVELATAREAVPVDEERLAAEAPALHQALLEVNRTGDRVVFTGEADYEETWTFLEPYRDQAQREVVILFQGQPYQVDSEPAVR